MSLFFTRPRGGEQRLVTGGDWFVRDVDWGAGSSTAAGVRVTSEKAMSVTAYWACVNLVTNICSDLPVDVFRGKGGTRVEVAPQPSIVASPSLLVSGREWRAQGLRGVLSAGNSVAMAVNKDKFGRISAAEWLSSESVEIKQDSSLRPAEYRIDGKRVPRENLIHLRGFVKPGSVIGCSPAEYAKELIGTSLAGEKYAGGWFGDGAHPSAIFQNTEKKLNPEESATVKQRFLSAMRGKREPLTVGSDWKYTPIQANPAESQVIESLEFSAAQTCRLFGPGLAEVLGYKTGGSLDYSTRLDRTLDLLQFTANHWVVKFEDLLTSMIPQPQYVKFNVDALLRTDPKSRWDIHQIARTIGAENIDEIRDHEDMPPLPNGQGQDYTPLGSAAASTTTDAGDTDAS